MFGQVHWAYNSDQSKGRINSKHTHLKFRCCAFFFLIDRLAQHLDLRLNEFNISCRVTETKYIFELNIYWIQELLELNIYWIRDALINIYFMKDLLNSRVTGKTQELNSRVTDSGCRSNKLSSGSTISELPGLICKHCAIQWISYSLPRSKLCIEPRLHWVLMMIEIIENKIKYYQNITKI